MQVVICAMAKNEHKYINEWVRHHLRLGFDKIYLYDNDDTNAPNVSDFINDKYKKKVKIIDIRGAHCDKLQQKIYNDFYNNYSNDFDWCMFCDIDEFLSGVGNVHLWLEQRQFRHINQIRIKWRLFGDDNKIKRDMNKGVFESFTKEIKHSLNRNLIDKGTLENQGKFIIRGGLTNVIISSPHFASFGKRNNVIPSVLPSGKPCWSKVEIKENYKNEYIFLNHYMTKTLIEFIEQKLKRTDAVYGDLSISFDYYWRINEKTQEKLDYIKSFLGT